MHPLLSLLTFRADIPEAFDIHSPISARFQMRKLLNFKRGPYRLLVASAGRTIWRAAVATFDKPGVATFSEPAASPAGADHDTLVEWLREFARTHGLTYIAVGIGHGFEVMALSAVKRLDDIETMRLLRVDPAQILDDANPGEKSNLVVHHPDAENSSLRFSLRMQELNNVTSICNSAGLGLSRIICEQAQLIELAYAAGMSDQDGNALLLTLPSSFLLIPLDGSGWHSITYDPEYDDQVISNIVDAAGKCIPEGGKLLYIDAGMPQLHDLLQALSAFSPKSVIDDTPFASFQATVLN